MVLSVIVIFEVFPVEATMPFVFSGSVTCETLVLEQISFDTAGSSSFGSFNGWTLVESLVFIEYEFILLELKLNDSDISDWGLFPVIR
mmetsp:Transcript_1063/g.1347  ORF Transcript_1063/g.1347 Transcript_1063/m.1347 type:complete len:88 (+) Transcript_1063:1489-1752(+)